MKDHDIIQDETKADVGSHPGLLKRIGVGRVDILKLIWSADASCLRHEVRELRKRHLVIELHHHAVSHFSEGDTRTASTWGAPAVMSPSVITNASAATAKAGGRPYQVSAGLASGRVGELEAF